MTKQEQGIDEIIFFNNSNNSITEEKYLREDRKSATENKHRKIQNTILIYKNQLRDFSAVEFSEMWEIRGMNWTPCNIVF